MNIKRHWKRVSDYYPEYVGRTFTEREHIRETVHIDLSDGCLAPSVTDHGDDTIGIHDTVKWGSITMTRVQAVLLSDRLNEALYRRRLK